MENGQQRMVKTPWSDGEIPFAQAARMGTEKVIRDHSTVGIALTCDGTFGEIDREAYVDAENKKPLSIAVEELNEGKIRILTEEEE